MERIGIYGIKDQKATTRTSASLANLDNKDYVKEILKPLKNTVEEEPQEFTIVAKKDGDSDS